MILNTVDCHTVVCYCLHESEAGCLKLFTFHYSLLPLNEERLQKLTENFIVSNEKILNALGEELPVSAEDGMRKTFNTF